MNYSKMFDIFYYRGRCGRNSNTKLSHKFTNLKIELKKRDDRMTKETCPFVQILTNHSRFHRCICFSILFIILSDNICFVVVTTFLGQEEQYRGHHHIEMEILSEF